MKKLKNVFKLLSTKSKTEKLILKLMTESSFQLSQEKLIIRIYFLSFIHPKQFLKVFKERMDLRKPDPPLNYL